MDLMEPEKEMTEEEVKEAVERLLPVLKDVLGDLMEEWVKSEVIRRLLG